MCACPDALLEVLKRHRAEKKAHPDPSPHLLAKALVLVSCRLYRSAPSEGGVDVVKLIRDLRDLPAQCDIGTTMRHLLAR